MPDPGWWQALWPHPDDVLRVLGVKPGMTVVDLCCGDGYFTAPLAVLVKGRVYAVDLDAYMLEKARAEVARLGTTVRRWICADATRLPSLVPEFVDFVLLANTFHGVPDKTELARCVAATLKASGLFAIVNWHPLPREKTTVLGQARGPKTELRMSPEQVEAVVGPAGFALKRVVELPPYHYAVVFSRQSKEQ